MRSAGWLALVWGSKSRMLRTSRKSSMLAPSNHKAPRSESRDGLREVLSDDLGILGLIAAARVGKLLSLAAFALALAPPLSSGAAEGGPLRPVRIMPLGDSITEGTSGDATWR